MSSSSSRPQCLKHLAAVAKEARKKDEWLDKLKDFLDTVQAGGQIAKSEIKPPEEKKEKKKGKKRQLTDSEDDDSEIERVVGKKKKKKTRRSRSRDSEHSDSESEDEERRRQEKEKERQKRKRKLDRSPSPDLLLGVDLGESEGVYAYRAVRQEQLSLGWSQAPCSICPSFQFCKEGGPVNPTECVYYTDWLAQANVQAVDEGEQA